MEQEKTNQQDDRVQMEHTEKHAQPEQPEQPEQPTQNEQQAQPNPPIQPVQSVQTAQSEQQEQPTQPAQPGLQQQTAQSGQMTQPTQNVSPQRPEQRERTVATENRKPLGFFSRVFGIIFYPGRVMEDLAEKPRVLFGLLSLLLATPIVSLIRYDTLMQTLRETLEQQYLSMGFPITGPEFETTLSIALYSSIAGGGVMQVLVILLLALGLFIVAKIFRGEGKYKAYLSISGYAAVISLLNVLLLLGVSYISGSMTLDLSLAMFLPVDADAVLRTFLSNFEIFNIWYFIVVGIGVAAVARFGKGKAIAVTTIVFALSVAISTGLVFISTMLTAAVVA